MGLLNKLFVYTVSFVIGCYISIRLLVLYIGNPSAFKVKERKEPPKCLTDPSVGAHGYLSLKELKIHYVEKGDRTKPLMLFVHGFPEFWYSWRYQIKEFSKDYWTVAIDMRGYGDSGKPAGKSHYAMKYLVNDIKEIVEALGRKKFILVAHDWGGVIAWNFVMKYPEMLESYVIMDAPFSPAFMEVVNSNRKQFLASWYIFFYQLPYLPELAIRANDFGMFKPIFKPKKTKCTPTVNAEDIEAFKYNFSKPGGITPPVNYYRANFGGSARGPSNTGTKKKDIDIDAPGLLMFGEFDDFLVLDHLDVAKKYVKKLQVKTVKGANHFVQQDDPQVVNEYMREFFQSL